MIKLFKLLDEGLAYTIHPSLRKVEEFSKLIRRDRGGSNGDASGRKKNQALKEFAFIFHMCHYSSPYIQYLEDERKERLGGDLFDDENYQPDEEIVAAMAKFIELTRTPLSNLLESAHVAVNKLSDHFETLSLEEKDKRTGQPIYKAKDVLGSLASLGKVVASLQQLEEQVAKEQITGNKVRGMELSDLT